MRILKENAVGLMIDVQSKLFPHIYEHEKLQNNTDRLLQGLKAMNTPMIVTEQYTKGLGETIEPLKNSLGEDYKPLEKMAFSCCGSGDFMKKLESLSRHYVIVFGIESHVCVLQTTLDLIEKEFQPVVVADCVGSRNPYDKKIALKRMRDEGAITTTYESILFEMTRISGTDEFKAISKIVK